MRVVVVEVALWVVKAEAMAIAAAVVVVWTISESLAFDGGGDGGIFDHAVAAGRRVVQGVTQWKPYYTTTER